MSPVPSSPASRLGAVSFIDEMLAPKFALHSVDEVRTPDTPHTNGDDRFVWRAMCSEPHQAPDAAVPIEVWISGSQYFRGSLTLEEWIGEQLRGFTPATQDAPTFVELLRAASPIQLRRAD